MSIKSICMPAAAGMLTAAIGLLVSAPLVAQESKNQPDSGRTNPVTRGVSDAFGYTVSDSSGTACAYDFIDIAATGTQIISGDDEGAPLTLAAPFDFYGQVVTQMAMTTNGYLSTDPSDDGPDLSNDCPLPAAPSTGGGARIYPLHDDVVGTGFYEFFATCPRPSDQFPSAGFGCHVFQWDPVRHFGDTQNWTFQAVLYDISWEIVFQHGAGNPELGSGSTTGLQNAAADDGLTYACNSANSIPDNSAQCFVHPMPAIADLSVSQLDNPDPVAAGTSLTWTVTVENVGSQDATNVVATDTLPAGVVLSATSGCNEDPSGTPTCTLGTIPAGESASYEIVVDVDPSVTGSLSHSVSVATDSLEQTQDNNSSDETTDVIAETDLAISKSDSADPVVGGSTLTWTVTVNNTGPSDATGVSFGDTLPVGVTLVETSGCVEDPLGIPTCSIGPMAAGGSASVDIVADIDLLFSGALENTAEVSATTTDPDTANNSATESTQVLPAQSDLALSLSNTAPPEPSIGDSFTITMDLANNGPQDNVNVVVEGTLIGIQFDSSACATATGNSVMWNIGPQLAQDADSCTFNVSAGNATGSLQFVASASGSVDDPVAANNTDIVTGIVVAPLVVPALDSRALVVLMLMVLALGTAVLIRR